LIAGKPNPASNPMIEITTSNSTKVNELLFAFGNLRDEVMLITMTTPTLPPFHQKILTHAKSAKVATDIYLTKNNPFRLYPESVGALRPLRAKARPGNAGREQSAFTLIELLAVITIIGILAGLTLGAAGAVRRHGATSTAKAEVAALQAACDRYYADYNAYPIGTADPTKTNNPTGSTTLFTNLLGSATLTAAPTSKRYFEPKPAMVSGNYFIDPWGYAYGYNCSTNSDGTWNPPLIWSTAGGGNTNKWITSWPKM
jgi:prepilin-type N-terminal cleavage/methylation domain-containing protein